MVEQKEQVKSVLKSKVGMVSAGMNSALGGVSPRVLRTQNDQFSLRGKTFSTPSQLDRKNTMSAEQIVAYPSPEEYLIRERKAKHRSEYENGEMIVMAGASYEHNLIVTNLSGELRLRLKKSPCTPLSQDMRVAISYRKYYYPDVVIVCDKPEFVDNQLDTLLNPIVVVEVLSPSTENRDRKTKLRSYRAVETIQEIVFVSQELPLLEVYRRGVTGWTLHDYEGLDAVLTLSSVNCEVPLSEIYDRMDFDLPPKNA